MKKLEQVFSEIDFPNKVKSRIAKIVLGSSVIRVFDSATKPRILQALLRINIDELIKVKDQTEFDRWHRNALKKVCAAIGTQTRLEANQIKWGHACKVLNLFLQHLVMYSPYFDQIQSKNRIKYFLHIPLDSKAFKTFKKCNISVPSRIKYVDKKTYYDLQKQVRNAAGSYAPIVLDEFSWS